jgi:hypothetical protein
MPAAARETQPKKKPTEPNTFKRPRALRHDDTGEFAVPSARTPAAMKAGRQAEKDGKLLTLDEAFAFLD